MIPRIKIKKLRGAWGTFNPSNGQIELSKELRDIPVPSKNWVKAHEEYHKFINSLDSNIKHEETLCHLWALLNCKESEMTELEWIIRKRIIKKYKKLSKKHLYELYEEGAIEI